MKANSQKKEHSTLYSYPTTLPRFHSLFLRALVSLCVALSPYLVVSAALVWCSFAAGLKKICANLKTRSYPSFDEFRSQLRHPPLSFNLSPLRKSLPSLTPSFSLSFYFISRSLRRAYFYEPLLFIHNGCVHSFHS